MDGAHDLGRSVDLEGVLDRLRHLFMILSGVYWIG